MLADSLLTLVGSLYEIALVPARWQDWLTELCRVLESDAGVLIVRYEPNIGDRGRFAVGLPVLSFEDGAAAHSSPARSPSPQPRYLRYLAEDSRLFRKVLTLREGELVVVSEVLPKEEFAATRFYCEWLRPRELHHVVSLIVSRTPRHITGLSLLRRPERPSFSETEVDCIQRLLPHLQRVLCLQALLAEAEQQHEVAHQILDSLRCGAILLDDTARVCDANERAAALLKRAEGLLLEGGELRAEDPRETPGLRSLLRGATGNGSSSGVLALSRAGRDHPLIVSASPLRQPEARASWLPVARGLLLVSDPEELPVLHEPALRNLYGLTPCEARIASMLAHGETIDAIASSLGVQRTTVRTHLQRALEKTGTHRQSELVRVLLMGHASLAQPGSPPSISS